MSLDSIPLSAMAIPVALTFTLLVACDNSATTRHANPSASGANDQSITLFDAINMGDYTLSASAVAAGADVNEKDAIGITPLHLAAQLNNLRLVRLLVENGADINARDDFGDIPLARTEDDAIAKLLGGTDVHQTRQEAHEAIVEEVVRRNLFDKAPEMIHFLVVDGEYPSPKMLKRLATLPGVIRSAEFAVSPDSPVRTQDGGYEGVKDRDSGRRGVLFYIDVVRWISDEEAEIKFRLYMSPLGGGGFTATARRRYGHWFITDYRDQYVS